MPAYPYACEKCGDAFEIRRGMTDESPVVCTACGSRRVRRVYHAFALVGGSSSSGPSADADDFPVGGSCCGAGGCGC
jgi:putative FmdB family regulatory protein